jgi:hypothetical protein
MTTLIGATVWEGAATVAPTGDLPDTGYYAATNSFPRNTVVDVTNLENGKSVRVIVAAGIETPGLLAILSRNAANMIGLSGRSVGRIRIAQLSDPIAFSRFTEGSFAGGDPDYDPRGLSVDESVYTPETARIPGSISSSGFFPESEWADDGYREIIDLPDSYAPPPMLVEERAALPGASVLEGREIKPLTSAEPEAVVVVLVEQDPVPAFTQGDNGNEIYGYSLIPAEERPPEPVYNIDEEYIVPSIVAAKEILPDESLFIDPIKQAKDEPPELIDETLAIAPIDTQPEINSTFSVPVIGSLEQGTYYVQLGAFSKEEQVEDEIGRIGKTYPLAVQNSGKGENPVYRILLGPLNLGESGALLQRFKSIGYQDAFVRKN